MSTVAQPPWHAHEEATAQRSRPRDTAEEKDRLRRQVRARRAHRSMRRRAEAAARLAEVVLTIPEVTAARCVSVYASRPGEPGTEPLIEALAARGVRLLVPVLGTGLQRDWAEYTGAADMRERAPGRPPEPGGAPLGSAALLEADVVLVPALAVDARGGRLGQGGGWYDRVLAHVRPGAPVIALVHEDEILASVPREAHDVPVTAVATPDGWRHVEPPDAPEVRPGA
ncbi:5-formyltetrahydrofolate cyclo-ligase [Cellulomonas dongxiuzhuiae]|uniref:5-formyltetrahydrofolate cyclo-ligase n=1 Tax=Cellulomonas dongxiuzhuiae TaxID=2819979 RepID=A0ABX8GLX6_9CELL|nr:5-formyltetrahydrofolate cyclo-ligase [Cellulomonas dongxiuzhuiae]MBO3096436.1 5-formyltetrahydrofolate cyclo-ligase [Cellulomonas dongxiuzhuiae]QWC16843.1 5-formyltetrahydrofolate cyclo-ligase [Cellulomonas dongxiuzhuiae]